MMATKKSTSRKRKRDKLQQYGVDLPDIPGLPIQVIPLHIHALKKTIKFVQHYNDQQVILPAYSKEPTQQELADRPNVASAQSNAVMDSIMYRLNESNTATTLEEDASEKRRHEAVDAVQSWLQAIHRHMRDQKQQSSKRIPVAAMQHLWDISTQHKRIATRRAAFFMVSHLIQKSADARRWLLEEGDVLVEWMDGLTANSIAQKEGYHLLKHLESLGYGDLYPTLLVALQRFQQQYPAVLLQDNNNDATTSFDGNMTDWRRLRDLALEHCDEEERRVQTLIRKCHACMDILVPRMGMEVPSMRQTTSTTNDEEEDDIDWEDGWEDDGIEADNDPESHAEAVERTLAVMQTTGNLRDGEMHINLQQADDDDQQIDSSTNPEKLLARARLQKCVQLLENRHMQRLSRWVEGVTNADSLMATTEGSALIRMPTATASRLKEVLDRLLQLKSSVASILSSAKQLGLEANNAAVDNNTSSNRPALRPPPVATNLMSSTRNPNLASNLNRRRGSTRDVTRGRSNRIQIKYRNTH